MKNSLLVASATICGLAASTLIAQPPASNHSTQAQPGVKADANGIIAGKVVAPLMRQKLERAKNMLEGLTMENYDQIASNARSMRLLSMEASWNVLQTKEYQRQSEDFRRSCDSIEAAAKAKNVNRAALNYLAFTARCVECHNYLREQKASLQIKETTPTQNDVRTQ